MSGGSFDYLYLKFYEEEYFSSLSDMKKMERWLREEQKHDAADELLKFILEVETARRRLNVYANRLVDIVKAAEWWRSCDWDEETFDEEVTKLLKGKDND